LPRREKKRLFLLNCVGGKVEIACKLERGAAGGAGRKQEGKITLKGEGTPEIETSPKSDIGKKPGGEREDLNF